MTLHSTESTYTFGMRLDEHRDQWASSVPGEPGALPDGGSSTLVEERLAPTDAGDHDRFSHYVPKEKLTEAMVMGTPVVALCGKIWIPSRDPQKYPVCPECKDIFENMTSGKGGKGGSDQGGVGSQ